ncbi:hypothetical protein HHI36_015713 [Cryptolaemus montrouzieri]|uniref:Tudor domain-containing protein n=1 Tax=Cryptolaemus montrouzieri TaxID=559131 RepID=A0ABD2N7J5_9CUCU
MITAKPITIALGLSLCGLSWYIIYKFLKKDEEDDYEDTIIKASNFKTQEIKVPKDLVREIIGRNGKNIKNVQEISGTKINFRNNDEKGERICVIRGSVEACLIAENIIREFIDNQPVIESEELWIPKAAAGKIIGRLGETIAEMQSISGAKISVVTDDGRNMPEVKVAIKGTKEQIVIAKSLVTEKLNNLKATNSKIESCLAKREPRAPAKTSKNGDVDSKKSVGAVKSDRLSPTLGQQESPFEVYVSAMTDPSRFWIQIVGPKATQLDQLVEEMTEYYNSPSNQDIHALDSVSSGDLVAAIFQYDNKWYRAEVLNVTRDNDKDEVQAELYYVDYGDTDIVTIKQIFELRTDFLQLHFQAIECYLANVEPVQEEWSEEAVDKFEEWTHVAQWKKLSAKINGYCVREKKRADGREGSPVPGVDLYDCNNEKDINIAEELVNHGFALLKADANLKTSRATSASSITSN